VGLIPGASGSASYLVEGLDNPESIFSSSHGSGRYHSRTEARRRHDEAAFLSRMEEADILHFGLAPDETYQAYKDIEMVIGLQNGVLVRPVARMHPKVVLITILRRRITVRGTSPCGVPNRRVVRSGSMAQPMYSVEPVTFAASYACVPPTSKPLWTTCTPTIPRTCI
jgi:hypothetical protein